MAPETMKTVSLSVHPPPRALDLKRFTESRAPELNSLFSVVANRLNNVFTSRRDQRRRTTGHDNRISKKRARRHQKWQQSDEGGESESKDGRGKSSRRIRRKMEFKKNPAMGFCTMEDGTMRLRTHLWHVKRFKMGKLWGFYLPIGLQGGGRGSRAVLKWLKQGALLHDASYSCVVQLEGPEDSILTILKLVLSPFPASVEQLESISCGLCCGNAMLHHIGAPDSQLIAPVTYMWRPLCRKQPDDDGNYPCTSSSRHLWILIHVAAFKEAVDVLRSACQKLMLENGLSVQIYSRSDQLAKLEIIGSKASQILKKVVYPVSVFSATKKKKNIEVQKALVLEHLDELPSHSILSLVVQDPRELPLKDIIPEEIENTGEPSIKNRPCISEMWLHPETESVQLSDAENLWMPDSIRPPVEDKSLCLEKHQRRLGFYYLDNSIGGSQIIDDKEDFDKSCPILIIKNNSRGCSFSGWSIVLPISWVRAFWISFVTRGARAIGLRERRWVACNDGIPYFPYDFPDCKAYSHLMAAEAISVDQKDERRPPSCRTFKVPYVSPWDCIRLSMRGWPFSGEDKQMQIDGTVIRRCSSVEDNRSPSINGLVIRTSKELNNYLDELGGHDILLFPNSSTRGKCFHDWIGEARVRWVSKETRQFPVNRKMCFLRVLLHTHQEGTFEQGALVCAPLLTDLFLWTSNSEKQDRLQISISSIKSYFKQGEFGNWEVQIPDDPAAQNAQRQLIGFVTSGFVRGSAKPVASALCEALLLAKLRHEQWGEMQEKGRFEVFVLVRNLRAAAYRLALASIVLEKQNEDVTYM